MPQNMLRAMSGFWARFFSRSSSWEALLCRMMFAGIREGIILWNADQSLVCANEEARRLLDLREPALVPGMPAALLASELARQQSHDANGEGVGAAALHGTWQALSATGFRCPGGRWVRISTSVIQGIGAVTVISDISEARERVRSHFLASKSQALRHMSQRLVHDLNNAYSVMLGNLEMLDASLASRSEPLPVEHDLASRALAGLRKNMALTNSLSDYIREYSEQSRQVRPADAIQRAAALFRAGDPAEAVISVEVADSDASVHCDAEELIVALIALLRNAVEASPISAEVVMRLSTEIVVRSRQTAAGQRLMQGRYVRIDVLDRGTGIDEATLDRIFDPFFTTRQRKGAGLGLCIAAGFCQRFGGALDADSAVGKGSCFMIYLPLPVPVSGMAAPSPSMAASG
jgi:signal transduction histidine kinase